MTFGGEGSSEVKGLLEAEGSSEVKGLLEAEGSSEVKGLIEAKMHLAVAFEAGECYVSDREVGK